MLFNSIEFLSFFLIVFSLYWFVFSHNLKLQNLFILASSYIFYGWWDYRFLFLIAFTTCCSYLSGIGIEHYRENKTISKIINGSNIVLNLGILGLFKYYNFFASSFSEAFSLLGFEVGDITLSLILPVGISFYTFQALSYSIDVYYKRIKATKDIIGFFAFVSFFPQLVAGPIERATSLLPQFNKRRIFDYHNAIAGSNLIIYGLFKKMVVADRLSVYVNNVYENLDNANTISVILAMIFFSFQIYCDFSGYTDIARGIAKLLGFELMLNFNRPYLAKSIPEFWKRWHISLSTWFKDYLYIPLGGNRVSNIKWYRNILIVFIVSGLWHGANWTFLIWGALHGIYQVCGFMTKDFREKLIKQTQLPRFIQNIYHTGMVFMLVSFAWIFFRASSLSEAIKFIHKIGELNFSMNMNQICAGQGPLNLLLSLLVIGMLLLSYLFPLHLQMGEKRSVSFMSFLILTILFISRSGYAEFIYFQF